MKINFLPIFISILLLGSKELNAQGSGGTLDIVCWNVEWLGASFENPADDNLQEQNVRKILRHLNADLYGLVEVVDSSRLRKLTDSLGAEFDYTISPFCSGNSTGTGNSWLNGQKLAFIYNSNIFSNVTARGLMRNSSNAYTNYASGRFPYMLSATVTLNGVSKNMNFILIHGKAGSTVTDFQRRREATEELKDSLDAHFSNSLNFIIGDYNDALHGTICTACGSSVSSYDALISDSTDSDHYKSITLPLGQAGQTSMTNFPNVVDNQVISNELVPYYIPGSASIRTEVAALVSNYGNTTSDHYPVLSQYNLAVSALPVVTPDLMQVRAYPNPFQQQLALALGKPLHALSLRLSDVHGRLVFSQTVKYMPAGVFTPNLPVLERGIYFLQLQTDTVSTVIKIIRL